MVAPEHKVKVSYVVGTDPKALVNEAIELIGGLEPFQIAGKKVLIKPNVVGNKKSPTTTNPEVVRALCRLLKKQGARQIWVGDMSWIMELPTSKQMRECGMLKVVEEEGATPVFFEEHSWVPVTLEGTRYIKRVYVSEYIYLADIVINLPVIKTHRYATYSICLKNFVGATHGQYRPYIVDASHWEEIVSEINKAYRPSLNLVDGTQAMVTGGPWSGQIEQPGVIIASTDRIAADVVGLSLLKTYQTTKKVKDLPVWKQRQIAHAAELGLGVKGPGAIELIPSHGLETAGDSASRFARVRSILLEE